jgi:serine protease
VAATGTAPSPSHAAPERAVHGLIVQLRDAPSHAALAHERAQTRALGQASHGDAGVAAAHQQGRWKRVMASMPALRIATRRAVGESAQLLRFEQPMSVSQAQALAAQLAQDPDVAWALPNGRERRLQAVGNPPGDPLYGDQWWLQQPGLGSSGAPNFLGAWTQHSTGSANAIVAVLDSGIVSHPDLAGKVIAGHDLVADTTFSNDGDGRDGDPTDPGDWVDAADLARPGYDGCQVESSSWHGTAIAAMIAANVDGVGGASINWPGRVLAVRVAAKCGAEVADIVDGMRWVAGLAVCLRSDAGGNCLETSSVLAAPRARVVNVSFGGDGPCTAYQDTIDALRSRGVIVVAAAGNEHTLPTRPAKCSGVIGVAALNRDGFKSTYSNFGSSVALSTVGGDDPDGAWGAYVADIGLLTAGNTGSRGPGASDWFNYYGTSFSTPIVAGAVSLMLAVNPNLTATQIEQGLRLSARPHVSSTLPGVAACSNTNPGRCLCTTATCGAGILDVPQALAYAQALASGNPYAAPNWPTVFVDSPALREAAAGGPDRPANPAEPPAGSGGGGGAMSALWLLALALACVALRRAPAGSARRRAH